MKSAKASDRYDGYCADSEEERETSVAGKACAKSGDLDEDSLVSAFTHKNKISTRDDALVAFVAHLSVISGTRISRNLPEINRRLDSLARLVEQGSTCAAVYYCPEIKRILVATNTIHSGSRQINNWTTQIQKVFQLITQCHLDVETLMDVLSEAILVHIQQEERHLWMAHKNHPDLYDPKGYIAECLEALFSSGLSTKAWRDHCLQSVDVEDDFEATPLYKKMIKRISRITRDFLKLRESLHSNVVENGSSASLFFSALRNNQFALLKEGKKDVHAEMRLSAYVKRKNHTRASFGISKLCCSYCNLGLHSVSTDALYAITTRGQHGQHYKWVMPDFIKHDSSLLRNFLGKHAYGIYCGLTVADQIKFIAAIEALEIPVKKSTAGKSMIADSSSSDVEFGLDCQDDDELKAVAFDQKLSDISHLRELTGDYSEEYQRLTDACISVGKAFDLFKNSPENFKALGGKKSAAIIADDSDEDGALKDLSDLLERDESQFHELVEDERNAIGNFGRKAVIEAMQEEIDSDADNDEPDDRIYPDTPYDRAYAKLEDDNGWEYTQNSEGEWVYSDSGRENDNSCRSQEENSSDSDTDSSYGYRR